MSLSLQRSKVVVSLENFPKEAFALIVEAGLLQSKKGEPARCLHKYNKNC